MISARNLVKEYDTPVVDGISLDVQRSAGVPPAAVAASLPPPPGAGGQDARAPRRTHDQRA
jgi:hypothetical protein